MPTVEASIKKPSFEGRLQLNDFMFKAGPSTDAIRTTASSAPPGIRRTSPKRKPTTTTAPYFPPSSPRTRKKPRTKHSYAPPSTYAHLPLLPDALGPDLLVLFVGLNPGLETARTGHAYAHPTNLFWRLLHASGLTPVLYAARADGSLPRRCGLGLTNIVARPSRRGAELAPAELDAGVAALERKCRACRPECVCLVGKGIWDSLVRVRRRRRGAGKPRNTQFAYGWQGDERFGAVAEGDGGATGTPWEGARIFVATSTSGLAASVRLEEKERIWKILGDWSIKPVRLAPHSSS
ncbi:uracil-DNA glycosylase-like protein [Biscogniauxia sp. FL1348]|nr:uracil-DNA glycosylase-like protein [Biscogniauxia sp. FL1348]